MVTVRPAGSGPHGSRITSGSVVTPSMCLPAIRTGRRASVVDDLRPVVGMTRPAAARKTRSLCGGRPPAELSASPLPFVHL